MPHSASPDRLPSDTPRASGPSADELIVQNIMLSLCKKWFRSSF
jgi:hypothetical protein